ncbi:MAG: protein translocase subunit SecD, partial [Lentisphaeria bacterium]|nr:protein translocase subunit SecD [Lentisphaeria bacterium]
MAVNDKRPVILRTVIALLVLGVFAWSTYPLQERDFYKTFLSVLKKADDPAAKKLVDNAQALQKKSPDMFDSNALLKAANDSGVLLSDMAKIPAADDNRDSISALRKLTSASIRRGIDLAGGVEFMMELVPDQDFLDRVNAMDSQSKDEASKRMEEEFNRYRDLAIEVLRKRLESNHIFESEIAPAGGRFISLKTPITSKDEKSQLKDLLSMSAKLHFRLVHENSAALVDQMLRNPAGFTAPIGYELMTIEEFQRGKQARVQRYFVKKRWEMDGKGIVDARAVRDEYNRRKIVFRFDSEGTRNFANVTKKYKGRQLAVVLDGKLYTAPTIQTEILAGSGEITGQFSDEEVNNIANALVSGSFPFMIRVDSIYDVDPTLGADNVESGVRAGIYGMIAVVIFMVAYYCLAGVLAVVALAMNVVLVLGALAAFDATLTLPGIAGIVLTMGMAVDANVLVFERIREELNGGKTLATAVDLGYGKALSAVLDANLTTLFTGLILYWAGSGAIKGFAVTLCIGILTSLFTALFMTRLMFDYLLRMGLKKLSMRQLLKNPNFDFLGCRKIAFAVSGLLIVGSLVLMAVKGGDMFGVDLSGGSVVVYNYKEAVPQQQIVDTLNSNGFVNARIAYKSSAGVDGQKLEIMVRESAIDKENNTPGMRIQNILNKKYPALALSGAQENSVGGLIGAEFTKSAIIALIVSMIGMIIYISLRYEFAYAMAGIIALLHDVIVATGIFLLLDKQISLSVIAAVLTVIGYSINDTIVIFDRIREDLRAKSGMSYAQIINASINQTLNRTLLTNITTALAVIMLLVFGGAAISDFTLLMLLGVIIGTYSSVFIASPIVALWHRKVVGIKETDTNFDESTVVE